MLTVMLKLYTAEIGRCPQEKQKWHEIGESCLSIHLPSICAELQNVLDMHQLEFDFVFFFFKFFFSSFPCSHKGFSYTQKIDTQSWTGACPARFVVL